MKLKIISLAALISFSVAIPFSAAAQKQNGVSIKRVSSKSKTATGVRKNVRAMPASINMATLLINDVVSVGPVYGDSRSKTFYWPDCKKFDKVPMKNREIFGNDEEAEQAGYKPARDCRR
jgi:hypothetical protein